MATENAPTTLREAIIFFEDYDTCRKAVEATRWPDGVVRCPRCGSDHVTYLTAARVWKCYGNHKQAKFSLKVGTIFEESPIGFQKWLPALWLLTNCKNGISSHELARALGVTQKTAWFMLARLRLALQRQAGDDGKLSGEVEVDESYIGGKARNMSVGKRLRVINGKRGMSGKVAVMALIERNSPDKPSEMRYGIPSTRAEAPSATARPEQRGSRIDRPHRRAQVL